jgi:hypothetical protein
MLASLAMISPEEFVERLCLLGADRGPRRFPRRRSDRDILIKSIRMLLDDRRTYTEREVDAVLREWCRDVAPAIEVDHVTLRRLLVDHGHLERTADGRAYRVGFPARTVAFALAVYELDVRATAAAYQERQRLRREQPPARPRKRRVSARKRR